MHCRPTSCTGAVYTCFSTTSFAHRLATPAQQKGTDRSAHQQRRHGTRRDIAASHRTSGGLPGRGTPQHQPHSTHGRKAHASASGDAAADAAAGQEWRQRGDAGEAHPSQCEAEDGSPAAARSNSDAAAGNTPDSAAVQAAATATSPGQHRHQRSRDDGRLPRQHWRRNALAAWKRLWRSQTSSWRKLRRVGPAAAIANLQHCAVRARVHGTQVASNA